MMLLWPWAKLEWRAVCAERCTYGSGRRSAKALLTPLATWAGFVYVAFVIDAFARRIVGWRVSRTAHAGFVLDALEQALHDRWPVQGGGLIHHSDRGGAYLSAEYQDRLDLHGIRCSMSRPYRSVDNAVAESFFHTLKTEWIYHAHYKTRREARLAIFEYIEGFYNTTRMHSSLDYQSPEEYERERAAA